MPNDVGTISSWVAVGLSALTIAWSTVTAIVSLRRDRAISALSVFLELSGDVLTISNFGTLPIRNVMVRDRDDQSIGLDLPFIKPGEPEPLTIPEVATTPSHIIFDDARGLKWIQYPNQQARRFRRLGPTRRT